MLSTRHQNNFSNLQIMKRIRVYPLPTSQVGAISRQHFSSILIPADSNAPATEFTPYAAENPIIPPCSMAPPAPVPRCPFCLSPRQPSQRHKTHAIGSQCASQKRGPTAEQGSYLNITCRYIPVCYAHVRSGGRWLANTQNPGKKPPATSPAMQRENEYITTLC